MRTDDKLKEICEHLRSTYGDFHKSCRKAGLSTAFVSTWIKDDPVAATEIEEARNLGFMGLESVAITRATKGTAKGIYYKGDKVDTEYVPSDTLLSKLMDARIPAYKKETQANQTFSGPTQINIMPRAENFEQWLEMKKATLDARAAEKARGQVENSPGVPKLHHLLQGEYVEVIEERPLATLKDLL